MKKKTLTAVIAVVSAVVLLCGAAAALYFFTDVFTPRHVYKNESVNALLKSSRNKTVAKDLEVKINSYETVKVGEEEKEFLVNSYYYAGPKTENRTVDIMKRKYGFLSGGLKLDGSEYTYDDIMSLEPNGFLKENRFGELYTVFKNVYDEYYFVIMKVVWSDDEEEIVLDRVYAVASPTILSSADFESFEIGKTTEWEFFRKVGTPYIPQLLLSSTSGTTWEYPSVGRLSEEEYKRALGARAMYKIVDGELVRAIELTENKTYLTTDGVMNVTLVYDETVGLHVVSARDFTEGCPRNPEDLI